MSRLLALLLIVTAFLVPGGTPATAAPASSAVPVSSSAPAAATLAAQAPAAAAGKQGKKKNKKAFFRPARGVTFNSAVGGRTAQRTIIAKLLRLIDHTPSGQEIRILSWNFLSQHGASALLRAQKRGVRVRLLMDNINNVEIDNGAYRRLRKGLFLGNKGRKIKRYSWARTCQGSCRGTGGSAHAKFFMFSKVGKTPRVVVQGSANLTEAATFNQWNDIYTHIRNQKVWDYYTRVFNESATDKKLNRPLAQVRSGSFRLFQFPLVNGRDPVFQLLNEVRCQGARNTGSGVTKIRIAPDVIRNDRGMRLAQKVRDLWNRGCDVRIGYTIVGVTVGRMLRAPGPRGPVPMRHLVQDLDDDGEFDNYFHLKAMSIVGNIGGNPNGYAVLNGSSNWSGLAARSDENLGIYRNRRDVLAYQDHIDYWYNRFGSPSMRTAVTTSSRFSLLGATGRLVQPTADTLVFGEGPDAVYEDGTPYSYTGVDPYANLVD